MTFLRPTWTLLTTPVLPLALALSLTACKKKPEDRTEEEKQLLADETPILASDAGPPPPTTPPEAVELPQAPVLSPAPLGLPQTPFPEYNPTTPEKVVLGELLFFDPNLSKSGKMACASCHEPRSAFSSPEALPTTAEGIRNQRHTPALFNLAYQDEFYWDGRVTPLEAQILGHWRGQLGSDPGRQLRRLLSSPVYKAHFERSFGDELTDDRAAEALAAFVRTLRSGGSPWDKYEAGDLTAVSVDAIAGQKVFNERAGCATCHPPPFYSDFRYHNLGLPDANKPPDSGRYLVSKRREDRGAFKTPSLRALAHSAPYFHNGSAATLADVLQVKEALGGRRLTEEEKLQLKAFLKALSPESTDYPVPELPTLPTLAPSTPAQEAREEADIGSATKTTPVPPAPSVPAPQADAAPQ